MGNFIIYETESNFRYINSIVEKFFCGKNILSNLFCERVEHFLFFDVNYVTEPHNFLDILKRNAENISFGYLDTLNERKLLLDGRAVYPVFTVGGAAEQKDLDLLFNLPAPTTEDASLQIFVKSGFAVDGRGSWGIWFSKYWEIAVVGFEKLNAKREFIEKQSQILFYDPEVILARLKSYREEISEHDLNRFVKL